MDLWQRAECVEASSWSEMSYSFLLCTQWHERRCTTGVATLRRDGFASVHASAGFFTGWMLTRLMRYLPDNPPWDPVGLAQRRHVGSWSVD